MTIKDMNIGDSAVVNEVGGRGSLRQHFLDMGVIPGTVVTIVKYAPMGDPVEIRLHGYELTLRLADCEKIVEGMYRARPDIAPTIEERYKKVLYNFNK